MHERLLVSIKVETRSTSRLRSALFTLPLFYLPMVKIYVRGQIPGDTVFTFPNGEETAILRGIRASQRSSVRYFKTPCIGPAPGIEPATSRSTVKRSTD